MKYLGLDIEGNKVDTIVRTAAKLFSTRGYLATSMNDIAFKAKISKGAIYHYFQRKDDILNFITLNYVQFDVNELENELQSIKDPRERIRFIITRHIRHYATYPNEAKVLFNEAYNLPPEKNRILLNTERKYYQIVISVLSEYIGDRLTKSKIKVLALTLFGMCNWIYSWYDSRGEIKPDDLAELIFNVFIGGMDGLS